ncbi:uncharacterized protein LOC106150843 [Lingula anatina]|nr:uncharacterized protein LOC106150843 [Lingula anatina]|eukprot:XP_013379302.1 uncharacterized protein LOC106150843 [Lingula anatina]
MKRRRELMYRSQSDKLQEMSLENGGTNGSAIGAMSSSYLPRYARAGAPSSVGGSHYPREGSIYGTNGRPPMDDDGFDHIGYATAHSINYPRDIYGGSAREPIYGGSGRDMYGGSARDIYGGSVR